ncbi:hypothetical protein FHS96_003738 [Sphingomonas zeicaulis]|uniref:hypothetical protein n=1 Tax=Sphingomonas zeicaulis TaxID=1632740 RepID=UPI003D1A1C8C
MLLTQLEFTWGRDAAAPGGYAEADIRAMAIGLSELNGPHTAGRVAEMADAAHAAGLQDAGALWTAIAACLADIDGKGTATPMQTGARDAEAH